ncbi:MAG: DASS family sodium-coupled anion symporter [Bdellovibrionales bacterium]|nr:DASS family sodium-coupled anion symporter [Bdellovibrionales bacterium]
MRIPLIWSSLLLPPLAAYLVVTLGALPFEHAMGLAVLASATVLWVTEAIPLPATALLVPVMTVSIGLLSAKEAFASFGNPIIYLFVGAFFLAKAMQKHSLDLRIAYRLLSSPLGGTSFLGIAATLGGISFFLSMLISNTATTATLCPVVVGIMSILAREDDDTQRTSNATVFLLLLVAYSSSIGGIATPVGTVPNLITLGFLRELRGVEISFTSWVQFAFPVALVMFLASIPMFSFLVPVRGYEHAKFVKLREHLRSELNRLGETSRAEKQVAFCFVAALVLWVLPGALTAIIPESSVTAWLSEHLPMSTVALGAGIALFLIPAKPGGAPNLTWDDAKQIDWGTIMLFGGGLCLGAMLQQTGLTKLVGETVFEAVGENQLMLITASALVALLITELASNTASTSILIPILIGAIPPDAAVHNYAPVLAACLAASYGFMLPVATPPNAIVFGTGKVPLRQMIRAGACMNVIGLIAVVGLLHFCGIAAMAL